MLPAPGGGGAWDGPAPRGTGCTSDLWDDCPATVRSAISISFSASETLRTGPFGPWRDRTPRSQRRRIPPAPASHFLDVRPRGTPGMENAANNGYTRSPRRGPASPRGVCPTGVTKGLSGRVTEEALGPRGSRYPPLCSPQQPETRVDGRSGRPPRRGSHRTMVNTGPAARSGIAVCLALGPVAGPPTEARTTAPGSGPGGGERDLPALPQRPGALREPVAGPLRGRPRRRRTPAGGEDNPEGADGPDARRRGPSVPTRPAPAGARRDPWRRSSTAPRPSRPLPGRRSFQRLNRAEYERSVRDLLAVDVRAGDYLPLDTKSAGFDNIADAQLLSPP